MAAAREPFLYATLGVPDTLDGRFDMVTITAFLLVHRLHADAPPGRDLAQAVFDAMFSDMDVNLREMGVGDLSVGRRVRAMWEAFHGRSKAYAAAMEAADDRALAEALARNVWRGAEPPANSAASLARYLRRQTVKLASQPLSSLLTGEVSFLPAEEAAR